MTLNDIKKAALMLMFTNYENDISDEDVDNITDAEYKKYLVNMNPCINRALGRIQRAGVLAEKSFTITAETAGTKGTAFTRYALPMLISDFGSISRIIYESANHYLPTSEFRMEADTLVIANLQGGDKYIVLYNAVPTRISLTAASDTVVNVPDYIAEIIPYFIKGELYEEDEPELAVQARNIFEAMLDSFRRDEYSAQTSVVDAFYGVL